MPSRYRYPNRRPRLQIGSKYSKNRRRKYNTKRALKPHQVRFSGGTRNANQVELIRPVTLKPTSIIKKFCYINTSELTNATIADKQNPMHITWNLNSPWLLQDDTYADQGNASWRWNKEVTMHDNGDPVLTGTSMPGMFDGQGVALGYANLICLGVKATITYTPLYAPNSASGAPTALFAVIQSNSNQLDNLTTIEDIYATPFSTVRKVIGGGTNSGDHSGAVRSAKMVIKYSPRRFNNLQSLRDNREYWAHLTETATRTGTHPADKDRLTFGVLNCLTNPNSERAMVSGMLQIKWESTYMFTEPFTGPTNQYPGAPAGVQYHDEL